MLQGFSFIERYYFSDYYRQLFISIDINVSLKIKIEYILHIANIYVILSWITEVPCY